MRIKRLLSVILCLVFVMSLFPLSGAAKSDRFVANDEQDISVSEVVYAEQGNVAIIVPKSFDGELHLSASNDIESNIECLTSAGKVRKFDGKSMTGKKSTVTIRSSILRFDEN